MIIPVYAALLALLFIILSFRTIMLRRRFQIGVGSQSKDHIENKQLLRAMRVHANFAEYIPLALLLAFMLEWQNASVLMLHIIGCLLLAGRLLHAYGVSQTRETLIFRQIGMAFTFTSLLISAISLVGIAIR